MDWMDNDDSVGMIVIRWIAYGIWMVGIAVIVGFCVGYLR